MADKKPFIIDENTYVIDFGQHKGLKLANVPPSDVLWWYENKKLESQQRKALKDWVEFYLEDIQAEIARKKKYKN